LPLELNVPQVPAGAHVQVTPPFAVSLATVAVIGRVSLTNNVVRAELRVTVIGADAAVIVIPAVLETTLVSSTTVAVMVTLPAGAVAGAAKVTAVPLADWFALNVPQPPLVTLPQAADQVTPPFLESLVTVAVRDRVVLTSKEDGTGVGVVLNEIEGVVLFGGGLLELGLLLLHATRSAIKFRLSTRRSDLENVILWKVIAHLR
jgi:hypothetical protein